MMAHPCHRILSCHRPSVLASLHNDIMAYAYNVEPVIMTTCPSPSAVDNRLPVSCKARSGL